MASLKTVLLIAALVLFLVSIWPIPTRFNLVAAGLACWVAAAVLP